MLCHWTRGSALNLHMLQVLILAPPMLQEQIPVPPMAPDWVGAHASPWSPVVLQYLPRLYLVIVYVLIAATLGAHLFGRRSRLV